MCLSCSPLQCGDRDRPHPLTDHDGWKIHGGLRPTIWGRGRRRALRLGARPVVSSCGESWDKLFKPTRAALSTAVRLASASLTADAIGGSE